MGISGRSSFVAFPKDVPLGLMAMMEGMKQSDKA